VCAPKALGPAHPDDGEARADVDQLGERIEPKTLAQRPNRRQAAAAGYCASDGRKKRGVIEIIDGVYIATEIDGDMLGVLLPERLADVREREQVRRAKIRTALSRIARAAP